MSTQLSAVLVGVKRVAKTSITMEEKLRENDQKERKIQKGLKVVSSTILELVILLLLRRRRPRFVIDSWSVLRRSWHRLKRGLQALERQMLKLLFDIRDNWNVCR